MCKGGNLDLAAKGLKSGTQLLLNHSLKKKKTKTHNRIMLSVLLFDSIAAVTKLETRVATGQKIV